MLSPLTDICNTTADLILDISHPSVDEDITKESASKFYIPYYTSPSTSVFIREIFISDWMQLYVSKMSRAAIHHVEFIIADPNKIIYLTSTMPLNSAKTIITITADNLIAPLA